MPGFTFPPGDNVVPASQDTGQGAADRIASWGAWTADPNPLFEGDTIILRQDNNQGTTPLGQGGCGSWSPILDGSSNGATSGGDNPFFTNTMQPTVPPITDDFGNPITDDSGNVISG